MPRDLIKKLPKYYANSAIMMQLMGTDAAVLDAAESAINAADAQCLISTADTSLPRWEHEYGIPNSEDSNERRRERLLARKRGGGTGTIAHLKSVISSFSNGEVEITELYGQYMITIKFVGVVGAPPYLDDVIAAIKEIIPAHIGYTIALKYNRHSDLSAYTHAQLAAYTHYQLRNEVLS